MAHAISCNSKGPLLIHIAKLFPKPDASSFDAFGRIFSGTVKPGDKACAVTTTCACPGLHSRRPAVLGLSPCIDSVASQQLLLLCGIRVIVWPDLSQLFGPCRAALYRAPDAVSKLPIQTWLPAGEGAGGGLHP